MTSVLFIMSLCVVFWYSYGMLLSALRVCVCVCVCVKSMYFTTDRGSYNWSVCVLDADRSN